MRGRLITIEGLDGAGKTTLCQGLAAALPDARLLREPGGVELSERIRALVKRVEVAQDLVHVVFLVDQAPVAPRLEKKSLQDCRGSHHAPLRASALRVAQGCPVQHPGPPPRPEQPPARAIRDPWRAPRALCYPGPPPPRSQSGVDLADNASRTWVSRLDECSQSQRTVS